MDQIGIAGQEIFQILKVAGYWVTLIAGGGQIIGCVAKKDVNGAVRNAFTYGSAFASLMLLKFILDLVQKVFI